MTNEQLRSIFEGLMEANFGNDGVKVPLDKKGDSYIDPEINSLFAGFAMGWSSKDAFEKKQLEDSLAEFAGLDDCESGACKI